MVFVLTGAGSDDANGLYAPSGETCHDAPVYENNRRCLLSREPHLDSTTGDTSFGWILGQGQEPLYAVKSAALTPPATGWKRFTGAFPLPQIRSAADTADGTLMAAQEFKDWGNKLFGARRYDEAEAQWTRALEFGELVTDEGLLVALYSNRAEVRIRKQQWGSALGDAQQALERCPTHDKALVRAAVATREMERYAQSEEYLQKCLEHNPKHSEAKKMLVDLQQLIIGRSESVPTRVGWVHQALQEGVHGDTDDNSFKHFGAKDRNSKLMFDGVEGYSKKRSGETSERPPLMSMPYHNSGLPQDQVEQIDRFFQESRDKNGRVANAKETYDMVKADYKTHAVEDIADGRVAMVDAILKPQAVPPLGAAPSARPKELASVGGRPCDAAALLDGDQPSLPKNATEEIDALFAPFAKLATSQPVTTTLSKEEQTRKTRIAKAREIVAGRDE